MAGAGYKLFNTGDVLTAAQVNNYLQEQVTMVFADSTARTTALSGVLAEGMMSYLQDTNAVQVYNGSAWVNVGEAGDITEVTAGTGLTGGGTSGAVTLTNDMATTITAKGDLVVGTGNATYDNLAAGSDGDTLLADSSATTGLRWSETYAAGKNKIINGAMLIDQRNAGASVSVNTINPLFAPDRWRCVGQITDGVFSIQQDSTAPSGFDKSLKVTTTTADASIGTTQQYVVGQLIEGFDCVNLGWGASGAKTVTLSFWVRSSLTGTFGGSLRNSATNRSYPFSYSISVADTWEKKTITIAGDTTGTWVKDSGIGIRLSFSIGSGTDINGTAGAWAATNYVGVTGQTNVIGTLNATWYITGVQLEIGSVATAFTNAGGTLQGETALCQRYYFRCGGSQAYEFFAWGQAASTTKINFGLKHPITMRVAPTSLDFGTIGHWQGGAVSAITTCVLAASQVGKDSTVLEVTSSGLTSGAMYGLIANNSTSAYVGLNAEL